MRFANASVENRHNGCRISLSDWARVQRVNGVQTRQGALGTLLSMLKQFHRLRGSDQWGG